MSKLFKDVNYDLHVCFVNYSRAFKMCIDEKMAITLGTLESAYIGSTCGGMRRRTVH